METGEHAKEIIEGSKSEVTIYQNPADNLLAVAVKRGASLDEIDKLMSLQERYERNEAKKAYTKAMAAFKSNAPEIEKDAHVKYVKKDGTVVEYNHASLGNVTNAINCYRSSGLSPK